MSNVAKLKKKAADFEQKRQFDKALAVYIELLDQFDAYVDELDVALFNRVGDLLLKQGNVADALDYYERAVDRYADGGFFNNAIALCNKILRQSPGRTSVYYKLGKISAQKGFKADAKQNFLEYADRMQKSGRLDEAFRALKEFADLCPDQDDIRLMLADQLSRQDRGPEAIEQLQTLFDRYSDEGRGAEAKATLDRIKAIDPAYQPRATGPQLRQKSDDLVFLDVYDSGDSEPAPAPARPSAPTHAPAHAPPPTAPRTSTPATLDHGATEPVSGEAIEGIQLTSSLPGADNQPLGVEPTSLAGLESTTLGGSEEPAADAGSLLDLEPTSFADLPAIPASPTPSSVPPISRPSGEQPAADFELWAPDSPAEAPRAASAPLAEDAFSDEPVAGGDLEFILPDDPAPQPRASGEILSDMVPPLVRGSTGVPQLDMGDLEIVPSSDLGPATPSFPPRPSKEVKAEPGVPLMDIDVPEAPVIDTARISKAQELPELSLSDELDVSTPTDEEFAVPELSPERTRQSTMMAALSVESLQSVLADTPNDNGLRRQLAEMMLESGDREGGFRELEASMNGYERDEDLGSAASVADELGRLDPESVRIQQKRVEYAFRTSDRARMVAAYLDLGNALVVAGQTEKARSIYQRVLDIEPDESRAIGALATLPAPAPADAPVAAPPRASVAMPAPTRTSAAVTSPKPAAPAAPRPPAQDDGGFVNLGDWLREDEEPKSTRMVTEEKEPTGDEEADFAEMLRKFKQGVAENVDAEDHQSHYDLGVAFKEMGLIDDAISEFQKALRAPTNRLPTYEALGQCFVEKEQYPVAQAILGRALTENNATDEMLIGVLYLLGRASEGAGKYDEALSYYQRVFVIDIQFHDVAERLNAVEQARR